MGKKTIFSPSGRMTLIWQIRLAAAAVLAITVGTELLEYSFPLGIGLSVTAVAVFGAVGGLYLPAYMRRLKYSLELGRLTVIKGVFTVKRSMLEFSSVTAVSVRSTPLMRLFGVRRLCLFYPRGRVSLPALGVTEAASLAAEACRR